MERERAMQQCVSHKSEHVGVVVVVVCSCCRRVLLLELLITSSSSSINNSVVYVVVVVVVVEEVVGAEQELERVEAVAEAEESAHEYDETCHSPHLAHVVKILATCCGLLRTVCYFFSDSTITTTKGNGNEHIFAQIRNM